MIARTNLYNNLNDSIIEYNNQQPEGRGEGNLFVGGDAADVVINDTDASLILTEEGEDSIYNNGTSNIVEGGEDADYVSNSGNLNVISGNEGDDTIVSDGNCNVISGGAGDDKIKSDGKTNVISGDEGNDKIISNGDNNVISGDNGDDEIYSTGNGNFLFGNDGDDKINSTGNNNKIYGGNGEDLIVSIGDYNFISGGNDSDEIISIGDYETIQAGEGDNRVVFWGDHYDITGGNGANEIFTLDYAIEQSTRYNAFGQYLEADSKSTYNEKLISTSSTTDMDAVKAEIAEKYNLSNQEIAILAGLDLSATYKDGKPLYAIAKSVKGPSKGQYVIVRRDGTTHSRAVSDGECIATRTLSTVDIGETATKTTTKTYQVTETYTIDGVTDVNVNLGDGENTVLITAGLGTNENNDNINVTTGNDDNYIEVRGGYVQEDTYTEDRSEESEANFGILKFGSTYTSPLIIDFNQDGVVSAEHGVGIDLDNNGSADGAASNGDKMLAMTDLNGNGKIDGSEVFGDQTVDPFTGEKLNAANGFDALAMVAQSAEAHTGVECINEDGTVDLEALNQALNTKGITLGFVSDENNTQVEELSKVATIDTANYTEQDATGDVQHRQLGSATFKDGSEVKVDDVWFTLTGLESEENLFAKNITRILSA